MKRIAPALIVGSLLALLLAPSAIAQERFALRQVYVDDFPTVALSVAGVSDPEELSVYEEGTLVDDVEVSSFEAAGRSVDVVLAIDTSGSMEGAAMASAKEAARSFVTGLPDHVRVGVVTFSTDPQVAVGITKNHAGAVTVIDGLTATGETAMYDAVARAAKMFSGDNQRNVILLSDGGDTTSKASLREAGEAARKSQAAVFSVGIEGSEMDVSALSQISRISGGTYAPAATAELSGVYETLAEELSDQVVISYESTLEAGGQTSIRVAEGAREDSALVLFPEAAAAPEAAKPLLPDDSEPLLQGTAGLIVVLTTVFLAIFLVLWAVLGGRAREQRDNLLARRFGLAATTDDADEEEGGTWIPDSLVEVADQIAKSGGLSTSLEAKLERAGWKLRVGEFVAGAMLAALGGLLLGMLLIQSPVFVVFTTVLGGAIPFLVLSIRISRRLKKLHEQLPDILMVIASSLRAGHSFMQALDAVGKEVGEPGAQEFGRLVAEIRLGRPVDDAMNDLGDRIGSMDFKWAVLAVNVQREVGGNLAEVLDTVAETMRERERVRRQVDVLSTEGRISTYILAALPILVGLYMAVVNPDYISLLFTTQIGLVMFVSASALLGLGILWMRKVVKIDV